MNCNARDRKENAMEDRHVIWSYNYMLAIANIKRIIDVQIKMKCKNTKTQRRYGEICNFNTAS